MVFNVDFCGAELLPDGKKIGQAGEINATEMRIKLTDEMLTGADFHIVAFSTESGVYCTDRIVEGSSGAAYRVEGELVINVWQQVSANRYCALQVMAYAVTGDTVELLRKTKTVSGLWFAESVGEVTAEHTDIPDLTSRLVAQLHNNFTTLAKFGEVDGELLWDGAPIDGITDYSDLDNKPKINGVELTGDKSLADIGAALSADFTAHINDTDNPHSVTAQQVAIICDITEGVAGFRTKLLSVLDSTKNIQTAPLYLKQETHNHRDLLLPMVNFAFVDDSNFGATFEIAGTNTNICADVYITNGEMLPMLSETLDEVAVYTKAEKIRLSSASTLNYITQDMTAAEIMAVVAKCVDENGAYITPIYLYDESTAFLPCAGFYYDNANNTVTMTFNNISSRVAKAFEVAGGEVSETDSVINVATLNHNHTGVYQPMISGKGLSTNDLTNTLKANYDAAYTHSQAAHAPSTAQANVIESINVNGTVLPITDKGVAMTVPTAASDINAATSAQGAKADSAIQSVKVNGTALTPDANRTVNIVEPQWRTLNNFTVTTASTLFTFTTDSNNVPYNLQAIRVKVMAASGAPANGNLNIKPSFDTGATDVMQPYFGQGVVTNKTIYTTLESVRNNGLFDTVMLMPSEYDSGTSTNIASNASLRGKKAASGTNTIKRVDVICSATTNVPANSTILIEGIDA